MGLKTRDGLRSDQKHDMGFTLFRVDAANINLPAVQSSTLFCANTFEKAPGSLATAGKNLTNLERRIKSAPVVFISLPNHKILG